MSRTWFITGTSLGLGRILTERLLERGDRVAATLRRPDALAAVAARHGDRLWVDALDVTNVAAVRRVVDKAFGDLGRIDVIVNNAGYGLLGAAEELDDEQLRPHRTARSAGGAKGARLLDRYRRLRGEMAPVRGGGEGAGATSIRRSGRGTRIRAGSTRGTRSDRDTPGAAGTRSLVVHWNVDE